jgi:calcineurin-like phosphoesterase family protein
MRNTFYISDTHYGHDKCCTVFKRPDGSPLRPFSCAAQLDEIMVQRWNSVVRPGDRVFHLGDVVINRRFLQILNRLNGDKRLIMGNHDIFDHNDYLKYFNRIHGCMKVDKLWLTHIPVHIDSVPHWALANVHGHIHALEIPHGKYFNVSVEQIDYTPIEHDELVKRIRDKQVKYPIDTTAESAIIADIA